MNPCLLECGICQHTNKAKLPSGCILKCCNSSKHGPRKVHDKKMHAFISEYGNCIFLDLANGNLMNSASLIL
jgi:hypothetical protein